MAEQKASPPTIKQTPAQDLLSKYVVQLRKSSSLVRYAEEREWATAGYFDQLKQWLDEDPQANNKLRPMTKNKEQKWPMPVTNLFSKTISTNANALGADIPEMRAMADNYDANNRRAAEAAERAIDAANRESGMEILNPILSRQVPLFGMGCAYDTIAFDHSTIEVPDIAEPQAEPGAAPGEVQPGSTGVPEGAQPQQGVSGAAEGQPGQVPEQQEIAPQITGVQTIPTARLKTKLLTPFEYYLPRDCEDANLSPWVMIHTPVRLSLMREKFPDFADVFTKDDRDANLAFFYLNTLRSLSYQSQNANDATEDFCTPLEFWGDWSGLPKDVQDAITKEWNGQPSEIYEEQGLDKLQAAIEYGIFCVIWNNQVIQWAENPWDGDKATTFFPWQKDAVATYPKGLSVELIPLTKKLNRIDSLIECEAMSNGVAKLLWPTTQTTPVKSGDPREVIQWDPQGDGKVAPQLIPGQMNSKLMAYRQSVVEDFKELGFTNSVAEGEMPGAGTAFRLAAYMGAKAEEARKTQRYLFEQGHEIRARKLLKMAKKVWTEPRKVITQGFNNRYGAEQLDIADLEGGYSLDVIQDSSRPKTMTEKLQALEMAQQGGYVNPQDAQTREYVLDTLGLQDLDPTDHLQYQKADRDLEKLKQGIQPMESPFEKWDIPLRVFANYTLTEEFEGLPDNIRNGILMWTQYISEKLSVANGAPLGMPQLGPPGPPPSGPGGPPPPSPSQLAKKGGAGGQPASHVLGQVPGSQVSNDQVQGAAIREAANVVPNSPSPSA